MILSQSTLTSTRWEVSANPGNVAWAGLGSLNMWEVTKDQKYLTAAQALCNWALSNAGEE
jgi:hypothetical protein